MTDNEKITVVTDGNGGRIIVTESLECAVKRWVKNSLQEGFAEASVICPVGKTLTERLNLLSLKFWILVALLAGSGVLNVMSLFGVQL